MSAPPPRKRLKYSDLLPRFSLRELCVLVIAVAVVVGWYVQHQRNNPERPPTLDFTEEFFLDSISEFIVPTDDSSRAFREVAAMRSGNDLQAYAKLNWDDPTLDGSVLNSMRQECLIELKRRGCEIHADGSESLTSLAEGFAIHYSSQDWRGYVSVHFVRRVGEPGLAFFRVDESLRFH